MTEIFVKFNNDAEALIKQCKLNSKLDFKVYRIGETGICTVMHPQGGKGNLCEIAHVDR